MTSHVNKIYWDSTVFLCFLKKHEGARRNICDDILHHARDERVALYTSTFTIAEVMRPQSGSMAGVRPFSREEIAEMQAMFQWPWLKKVDLDQRVAKKAVEIEGEFALSAADSIHAASAMIAQVDVLQHWERKEEFGKLSRLILVEQPQMLTYGGVTQMSTTRARPDGLFRTAAANANIPNIRLRSRA